MRTVIQYAVRRIYFNGDPDQVFETDYHGNPMYNRSIAVEKMKFFNAAGLTTHRHEIVEREVQFGDWQESLIVPQP